MRMTRIDKEGVPMTVQHVRWNPFSRMFEVELWNGKKAHVAVEVVDEKVPLLSNESFSDNPTPRQWGMISPVLDMLLTDFYSVYVPAQPKWPTPTLVCNQLQKLL